MKTPSSFFFFFSSRRRHTRSLCDWSSDVCSSDLTPYEMLGRVLAVNSMFTGSSGSLGEFRAGAVAAALGAVPSALIGGLGTIAVMLIWMWAFPQLRRVDKLTPEAGAAP